MPRKEQIEGWNVHVDVSLLEGKHKETGDLALRILGERLQELAHAYHDRVLDFDHPGIISGYKEFCDSRKFDNTAHVSGRSQPHYGLTDHKEYFA